MQLNVKSEGFLEETLTTNLHKLETETKRHVMLHVAVSLLLRVSCSDRQSDFSAVAIVVEHRHLCR